MLQRLWILISAQPVIRQESPSTVWPLTTARLSMAMTWLQLLLFLNSLTVPLVPAPPLRLPLPLLIRIWAIVLLFSILRFIVLMTPTVNSSTTTLWMPTFPLLIVQMLPVLQPAELSLTLMAQPEPKLNLTLTAALA